MHSAGGRRSVNPWILRGSNIASALLLLHQRRRALPGYYATPLVSGNIDPCRVSSRPHNGDTEVWLGMAVALPRAREISGALAVVIACRTAHHGEHG